jgi:cell filamentation protein
VGRQIQDGSPGQGEGAFCYPEHIEREMKPLFHSLRAKQALAGLKRANFVAEAASFLATLNAIHPFREGNGRTQMTFLLQLAAHAGHPIGAGRLQPKPFLSAMVASFKGDERPLLRQIARLTE